MQPAMVPAMTAMAANMRTLDMGLLVDGDTIITRDLARTFSRGALEIVKRCGEI